MIHSYVDPRAFTSRIRAQDVFDVSFRPECATRYIMSFDQLFDELAISTDPFALCELRGTCDLGLGRDTQTTLHYILSGNGEIDLNGRGSLKVSQGSLVLIPAMQTHALRNFGSQSERIPECKPAALNIAQLVKHAEEGGDTQLIALCAHVHVGLRGLNDVIDLIREPLVETVTEGNTILPALTSLLAELTHPGLGSRAMIRAILTQCMIDMLRKRLTTQDKSLRWMAALTDPTLWNALRAMLDDPGANHSVDTLADLVGMSRSAFALRFSEAYGSGPMELLRDLRMRQAGHLLRTTDLPIKRIAHLMGFASRSAFSRRFETSTGQSPSTFRKE